MTETIFITALIVLFLHVCCWEGMIFSFVSGSLKDIPDYLKKPLYSCPICMLIWWGPSIVACGIVGNIWQVANIWQLSIIITAAAGVNTVFIYIISVAKAVIKDLKEDDCCSAKPRQTRQEIRQRRQRLVNSLIQYQTKSA